MEIFYDKRSQNMNGKSTELMLLAFWQSRHLLSGGKDSSTITGKYKSTTEQNKDFLYFKVRKETKKAIMQTCFIKFISI